MQLIAVFVHKQNKGGDLQQYQVVSTLSKTPKHPMQKHKADKHKETRKGQGNVNAQHRNIKHKELNINQRDQWATGADLGRPSATEIAEGPFVVWFPRPRPLRSRVPDYSPFAANLINRPKSFVSSILKENRRGKIILTMSLTKSANFEHAQSTIQCDHCGGVDDVNHHCLICEETMCPACKAIHNKARATRDHQVVLREERLTKNRSSTFCKKHPDQKTSLYCDTCNIPVCTKCIAETHYGHKFSDISKILQSFKREIEDSKRKMKTRMKEVNALIQNGVQSWKDYENKVKSIESSISHDTAVLYSLVDKMAQEREDQLNSIKHQDRKTWETAKGRLDEEKTKISTSLVQHDKYLSSTTTTTGMAELLEESKVLRSKLLDPIKIVPPSYQTPSHTSVEGIGEIIKQSKVPTKVHNNKLKVCRPEVISSFNSTLKGYPFICYAGNDQILMGTAESNDIHTVNSKGKIVHKRENVLRHKCYSLALTISQDILVSPQEGNHVDILRRQNKLTTFLDTSPYETRFITLTEKQEILVCLKKDIYSNGRVILCDRKGGNQRHIGSDDLYESPIQAVQLQDGGFCISDYGKERLVLLNSDCNIRHIIQNPLGRKRFWPRGICTDKAGNILATDGWNTCVYVIGKDMSVRELVGKTEGITLPRCLCVDDDNNLWVAQKNCEIKAFKYLKED
ncbi:hypothetical protein FSP39_007276 [Pinctada imbricata]|uniref:B box-type domain-containing protein n=1 Tax=Pinctada imbricata TaxID=66713 RepID=A0AA88XVS1_PINIB|nr:hypothetical protein FSP39_007276 [Pinctada imbricata]